MGDDDQIELGLGGVDSPTKTVQNRRFRIKAKEIHYSYFVVVADSKEEALDRFADGDGSHVNTQYSHIESYDLDENF